MANPDYVIVGGGSAGGVLAARLSEDPEVSVLLLEAGGDERRPDIEDPSAWPTLLGSEVDWGYATTTGEVTRRSVPANRGRVLGGCGSINVMAHLRGHRSDFDTWAALGATGWAYSDVLPYFMRSEQVPHGDPAFRGREGPLRPAPTPDPHPLSRAHVDAARLAGHRVATDLNDGELLGAAAHDLLVVEGRRQSVASAYLRPVMDRPNVTVRTGAVVRRLIVAGEHCRGVEYVAGGSIATALAEREVILSAGAVDSPKLLMLAGIGPAGELEAIGITPVVDLPGVGRNLQDHVMLAGIRVAADRPLPPPRGQYAESTLFLRTDESQPGPELQIVQIQVDYHLPWQQPVEQGYSFGVGHMRPESRGTVRLGTPDPTAPPIIDPRYLTERRDVEQLKRGLEEVDRLVRTGAFSEWGGRSQTEDILALGNADLDSFIGDAVSSFFHLSGTCRMGTGEDAVVDPELRVHGLSGLRVVDASVMPRIVSSNTNAATIMIAEKAADLLRDR